ncbi:hypothetical protein SAMN04488505_102747 [Chitinophaga rupis]|uniref:Uncharacterized protein n=1 Tax=Chitinophaga rupis TaxID=573321 RepID=A0A1H7RXE3_9BACT|nr:hypothetical protein [Chitinophaga rupis]SEL64364.1 hypothetical protein SAMN04488505_102747 [Chitinophaga rupis]
MLRERIFSKVARILNKERVANRSDFAVVPIEGFNPTRLRAFKDGIEKTIGATILSAVIFDRDYRSETEVKAEQKELMTGNYFAHIHSCKEIENFLLVPAAIRKAIKERINETNVRTGKSNQFEIDIIPFLDSIADEFKHKTQAQLQSHRLKFEKSINPRNDESTIIEKILREFETQWANLEERLKIVPGKDFLASLNTKLQADYKVTITATNIINSFQKNEVPVELKVLIEKIEDFRKLSVP